MHLRSALPGHFFPKPGVSVDKKEERVERSAGAEVGASMGGAGLHAGAGAEGNPQNVSHGASAWTVVGGEGDGAFQIPGCGEGTGRAALCLMAQP